MNQQRKSVYTLRRQILTGQYRTVPTEEEFEKGERPQPVVTEVNEELAELARPIVEQMIKHHGSPLPAEGATPEEIQTHRDSVGKRALDEIESLRQLPLERDLYAWFGCRLDLRRLKDHPKKCLDHCLREVGMSLTEQYERLLDLVDGIIGTMIEHACPPNKHYEDWDLDGLADAYEEQFAMECSGVEGFSDREDLAAKLYEDAESVLMKKFEEIGSLNYLRFFRNMYMQEIDRQWIQHLQAMDHLRDGIGLRGYGQRDPKREYKREGYDIFLSMTQSVQGVVASSMFRARIKTDDIERLEAQRRRTAEARLSGMRTSHPDAGQRQSAGQAAASAQSGQAALNRRQRRRAAARGSAPERSEGAPPPEEAAQPHTIRREGPKLGRNDPCHCGSGKKYKNCHYREDQRVGDHP
jgi:preprotein translocase subunit SecA